MAKPDRYNDDYLHHTTRPNSPRDSDNAKDATSIPDDLDDPLDLLRQRYDCLTDEDISTVRTRLSRPQPPASVVVARLLGETSDPNERERLGVLVMVLRLLEWGDAGYTGRSRAIRRDIAMLRVDNAYTHGALCADIARKYGVSRKAVSKHLQRFEADFPGLARRP